MSDNELLYAEAKGFNLGFFVGLLCGMAIGYLAMRLAV